MLLIKRTTRSSFRNLIKLLERRNRNKLLQQLLHQIENESVILLLKEVKK